MNKNKALISLGGNYSGEKILKAEAVDSSIVIAADSGYLHLINSGIIPDILIGDMDSIGNIDIHKKVKIIKYPEDKNFSDSELAVKYAIENKINNIVLVNSLSINRPDHLFSNFSLLAAYPMTKIVEKNLNIFSIKGPIEFVINAEINNLLSLFSFTDHCEGLTIKGVKYQVQNYILSYGSRGLSNIVTSKKVSISLKKGNLLIFRYKE